jgi:hypothetical protein
LTTCATARGQGDTHPLNTDSGALCSTRPSSLCWSPGPFARRPHCTPAPLHAGPIAPWPHCTPAPLRPGPIVTRPHCTPAPLHPGPIAPQPHCTLAPLRPGPIAPRPHCTPAPLHPSPTAPWPHCTPAPPDEPAVQAGIFGQLLCVHAVADDLAFGGGGMWAKVQGWARWYRVQLPMGGQVPDRQSSDRSQLS